MKAYIYQILNKNTGKTYVGSTSQPTKRKYEHFRLLKQGKHHSKRLQNSYNKHGVNAFEFSIIEEFECDSIDDQISQEQKYLDKKEKEYNMSSNAATPITEIVWTEELKKQMGEKVSRRHKGKMPKNWEEMIKSRWKPILEYENGEFVKEYESTASAGRELGISYKLINNVLVGYTKKVRKFPNKTWKYA